MPDVIRKLTSWRAPTCTRTVRVSGRHALPDVHQVIQRECELDDDYLCAFFLCNDHFDTKTEFSTSSPRDPGRARLDGLFLKLPAPRSGRPKGGGGAWAVRGTCRWEARAEADAKTRLGGTPALHLRPGRLHLPKLRGEGAVACLPYPGGRPPAHSPPPSSARVPRSPGTCQGATASHAMGLTHS
jgi:hypothetical protein